MPHYTYTVLHNDKPIARAEADRIDEARNKALDSVPASVPRYDLWHETIIDFDPKRLVSGPCFYPFH